MIFSIISSLLLVIGIGILFGLTPERVTTDLLSVITPHDTLREQSRSLRENKKRHSIYEKLMKIKTALTVTGKAKQFSLICFLSVVLFVIGILLSVAIKNLFLLPTISIALALVPFIYTTNILSLYERTTKEELETTLSIISTSYIRNDDIVYAVQENIEYIKPPIKEVFKSFETEATLLSSDIKKALHHLKRKIDDEIFREWCDALIQCQDDRTLKDTLLPIVSKLTDVRVINNELKTMLQSAKNEYWMMVLLLISNIPILYMLNKDWFNTLVYETSGKAVLGICGVVILVTALFMIKFTKPVEYKR
jgi:Flp pilus assembly protein TadB